MIFSIRHRILMPFLFITAFMTFTGIFFAVSFVQNYYNQQLANQAYTQQLSLEHHQIAFFHIKLRNKIISVTLRLSSSLFQNFYWTLKKEIS